MARLHFVIFCLILTLLFNFIECSIEAFYSNYEVVRNEADFLSDNQVKNLQPNLVKQEKFDEQSQRYQLVYQFGQRIDGETSNESFSFKRL